ncbi:transposase [Patescibacteria group bacterium]|nr:transposase [Patescibacteria group bacterium]
MSKLSFKKEVYYHIFNRGVEKRDIFLEKGDFLRFVHYLYNLNDFNPLSVEFRRQQLNMYAVSPRTLSLKRDLLIDIIAWVLMPNHYHLLLRQRVNKGISKFMQKLGTAWTEFFNAKYKHSGVIFQGKFKAVEIKTEAQFIVVYNYIHTNPINLIEPNWKKEGIENPEKIMTFLNNYRWSSYLDYIGERNFSSIINQKLLKSNINSIEGAKEIKQMFKEIIFNQEEAKNFLNKLNMYAVSPRI